MEIIVQPGAFEINGERLDWQIAGLSAYERHFGPSRVHFAWGASRKPISSMQLLFETEGVLASQIIGIAALRTMNFRFQKDRPSRGTDGMAPQWGLGQFDGVLEINGSVLGQGSRPGDLSTDGPFCVVSSYAGYTLSAPGLFGLIEFRRELRGAPIELEYIYLNWNSKESLERLRPDLL